MNDESYVIYPSKLSQVDCFHIGRVGRLSPNDMRDLVAAIGAMLAEMSVS